MLKKAVAALAFVMLFSCSVSSAFAQTITDLPKEVSTTVNGHYESVKNYDELIIGDQVKDTITLDDGAVFSASSDNIDDNGISIVIIPVRPGQASEPWVRDNFQDLGDENAIYYLAFYKDGQKVQPNGNVTVSMTIDGYDNADIYYMDSTGACEKLDPAKARGINLFNMDAEGHYIAVNSDASGDDGQGGNDDQDGNGGQGGTGDQNGNGGQSGTGDQNGNGGQNANGANGDQNGNGDADGSKQGDDPKTGDMQDILMWCTLLIISGGALYISSKIKNEK